MSTAKRIYYQLRPEILILGQLMLPQLSYHL